MFVIDKEKFGAFVASLRKEKEYTQKELVKRLFISDKAVSKWESAVSIPNITVLIPLSELIGVSVTELLLCERNGNSSMPVDEVEDIVIRTYHRHDKWKWIYGACVMVCSVWW